MNAFNDEAIFRSEHPLIETRLLRCLQIWSVTPGYESENDRPLYREICSLLEYYICGCIAYGPKNLRGWWSDGVIYLEIVSTEPGRFKLIGTTWIDSSGIAPFEIDLELVPNDDIYFERTVFRLGTLDNYGRPTLFDRNLAPTRIIEERPRHNRDWAMAVELVAPKPEAK
jgi:hypothetical protein